MWILIITLLTYSDPTVGRFSPTVHSLSFKSKNAYESDLAKYKAEIDPIAERLNKLAQDERMSAI